MPGMSFGVVIGKTGPADTAAWRCTRAEAGGLRSGGKAEIGVPQGLQGWGSFSGKAAALHGCEHFVEMRGLGHAGHAGGNAILTEAKA